MSKIFISYRRQDSRPVATLIYDPLARHFEAEFGAGAVFMDVHGIPLGVNFRSYLNEQVANAELLLALIADRWLTAVDEHGARRIDSPNDFVRIEIEAALKRGIPVVPVYVDDAKILREVELPDSLKDLAWYNGYNLSTDGSKFAASIASLIAKLEPHFVGSASMLLPTTPSASQPVQYEDSTQRLLRTFSGHTDSVCSVAFSPDGKTIISLGYDKSIVIWDANTGSQRKLITPAEDYTSPTVIAFSPSGECFCTASHLNRICIWDALTADCIGTLSGHENKINSIQFSADGTMIVSGSSDKTVRVWDVHNRCLIQVFDGHKPNPLVITQKLDEGDVYSVSFSHDGMLVASGSGDNTIKLWELSSGRNVATLRGHADLVQCVAFSPDGASILSCSADKSTRLWAVGSGAEVRRFVRHSSSVNTVSFSPHGDFILSGSCAERDAKRRCVRGSLMLWETQTGRMLAEFTGHNSSVVAVTFSPSGRFALSGSLDKTLKLWDVSEWTQRP